MNVEFSKKFVEDLDRIKSKTVKSQLWKVIVLLESAGSINEVRNLKKMIGSRGAYRIRVGDYRLGFFLENGTILIGRFAHRKNIYKLFP